MGGPCSVRGSKNIGVYIIYELAYTHVSGPATVHGCSGLSRPRHCHVPGTALCGTWIDFMHRKNRNYLPTYRFILCSQQHKSINKLSFINPNFVCNSIIEISIVILRYYKSLANLQNTNSIAPKHVLFKCHQLCY